MTQQTSRLWTWFSLCLEHLPVFFLLLANSYSNLKTQLRSLLLQGALPDLQAGSTPYLGSRSKLGSPVPALPTLGCHSLVTGLSPPRL